MHILIDADCLIAGTLTSEGATTELLDLWLDGEFELIVCPQLIQEVVRALLHPRISNKYDITKEEAEGFAQRLFEEGVSFDDPLDPPRVVPHDPNDDYLVALALTAEAEFLVTRDRHFEQVRIRGLPIVSPRQMIRRLRSG
ncbi:MAG: putative toxin-antitoxin system toxin component, PIN family [Pyrinomonadaceae bacterium]|nr:putative toxin-antitoxin system toxin component, PIN family [Pyrinomonadaceae bacterium]